MSVASDQPADQPETKRPLPPPHRRDAQWPDSQGGGGGGGCGCSSLSFSTLRLLLSCCSCLPTGTLCGAGGLTAPESLSSPLALRRGSSSRLPLVAYRCLLECQKHVACLSTNALPTPEPRRLGPGQGVHLGKLLGGPHTS